MTRHRLYLLRRTIIVERGQKIRFFVRLYHRSRPPAHGLSRGATVVLSFGVQRRSDFVLMTNSFESDRSRPFSVKGPQQPWICSGQWLPLERADHHVLATELVSG
jgi:hypothetical protein